MGWESFATKTFDCGCKIIQGNDEACAMGPWTGCKTGAHLEFCDDHSQMNVPVWPPKHCQECDCFEIHTFNKLKGTSKFPKYPKIYKTKVVLCPDHQHKYDYLRNIGQKKKVKELYQVKYLESRYNSLVPNNPYERPPNM